MDIALLLGYYDHVLKLPMNFFGTRKVGEIISRFQDASSIRDAISNATLTVMIDTIMAIAGGLILFFKNKALFAIAFVMVLLYGVLVIVFNKPYWFEFGLLKCTNKCHGECITLRSIYSLLKPDSNPSKCNADKRAGDCLRLPNIDGIPLRRQTRSIPCPVESWSVPEIMAVHKRFLAVDLVTK